MANPARLEVEFKFGGKSYTVKPTFEVVAGIETVTGQSCSALADKFLAVDPREYPSLALTAQVIYYLLKPVDKAVVPEMVGETLMAEGMADLWTPLGDFLGRAIKGNREHTRRAEEEARRVEQERASDKAPDPHEGSSTSNGG